MARIRRGKGVPYYTLARDTILSKNLSLKAKALLAILLNLPVNWHFTVAGILSYIQEGREAVMSALKELESAGYVTVTQARDEKGRMKEREYIVRELKTAAPESGKPQSVLRMRSKTIEDKPAEANRKKYLTNKEIQESFAKTPMEMSQFLARQFGGSVISRNEAVKEALKNEGDEKEKGGGKL
jgi:DNA-binding transcriptional ArsR family regulator